MTKKENLREQVNINVFSYSEQRYLILPNFFRDLDICPINGAEKQTTIQAELHYAK